ncbi:MAG: phosphatase PAP2 family protein [Deltaproteobacteria bacterium]|nr:phosphatase PAP2 family protein [Deltaproteobacteria bacterium]
MSIPRLVAVLLLIAAPGSAMAAPGGTQAETTPPGAVAAPSPASVFQVDWVVDGSITGVSLGLWVLPELFKNSVTPAACRWCSRPEFDGSVHDALAWSETKPADITSNVLVAVVPLGVGLMDFVAAQAASGARTGLEDLLIVAEAITTSGVLTTIVRFTSARQRPYAYYDHGTGAHEDHLSFWSGHSTAVFAATFAAGYVAQQRGWGIWPWIYVVGVTGGLAMDYFRLAADKHWLTDQVAGMAVGVGVGLLVPWLHRQEASVDVRVVSGPGGVAVIGQF